MSGTMRVLEVLKSDPRYSGFTFRHEKCKHLHEYRQSSFTNTKFMPDGGFIWATSPTGKDICVLITEAKHQGTNDARLAEGKAKQARGNAIERAFKNPAEANVMLLANAQMTFPYVMFVSGNDFAEDSTLRDRIGALCPNRPFNSYNVERDQFNQPCATVFVREERWTSDEVFEHGLKVARMTLDAS